MKNIKYLFLSIVSLVFIYSCDTNDEVTGYDPANYNYTFPGNFNLAIDETFPSTDTSFQVVYTPKAAGKGYYLVLPASSPAPTSTEVHDGGNLQSGSFDVDGSTPVTFLVDQNLIGANSYKVYAIHQSTDNFISEETVSITYGTSNTTAPEIVSFNPEHMSGGHEFDNQSITFTFNEPVKYVLGSTIDFVLFENGVGVNDQFSITDPTISMGGTIVGEYATEYTISGWNGLPNNFTIPSFVEGVFVDQGDLKTPELVVFDYYFLARQRTLQEFTNLLIGDWTYEITNGAFNPAVLSAVKGDWSIVAGTNPNTIILSNQVDHDINAFLGTDDSDTKEFEVIVGIADSDGFGFLYMEPQQSGLTAFSLFADGADAYWTAYYEDVVSPAELNLAGFYDLSAKTVHLRLDFGDILGHVPFSSNYFGDITYDYTYVEGSGALGKQNNSNKDFSDKILEVIDGSDFSIDRVFSLDDLINQPIKKRTKIDSPIAQ